MPRLEISNFNTRSNLVTLTEHRGSQLKPDHHSPAGARCGIGNEDATRRNVNMRVDYCFTWASLSDRGWVWVTGDKWAPAWVREWDWQVTRTARSSIGFFKAARSRF